MQDKDLKQAVEQLRHCQASFLENVAGGEVWGQIVWNGVVLVFKIEAQP